MLLTRSPLVYPRKGLTVRLACVKHTASVRPEPGSNSPSKKQITGTPTPTKRRHRHTHKNSTENPITNKPPQHTQKHMSQRIINQRKKQETNQKHKILDSSPKKFGIDLKHAVEFSRFGSHQSSNPTNFTAFPPNVKFRVPALSCIVSECHRPEGQLLYCTPRIPVSQTGLPGLFLGDVDKHLALSGIHLITHSPRGSSRGSAPVCRFPAVSGARENITHSPRHAQPYESTHLKPSPGRVCCLT